MYETMAKAMTTAADRTVDLAKQTPHRVMRELYQQFIEYSNAFTSLVPTYVAENNELVGVVNALANSVTDICSASEYQSSSTIIERVTEPEAPSRIASAEDLEQPKRFLEQSNSVCSDWASSVAKFDEQTSEWQSLDPKISAADWTADQKQIFERITPVMSANADNLERLGRSSGNPILEDFAVLAAQYQRGYVAAIPSYTSADNFLWQVVASLVKSVNSACKAAP
ncbi:hypothetical protein [Mycolicibacterium septicum]|uniref:hypothetical protein n=1 Tax=Mycolicibacterium septicum TaxID=98668 RepID=UPI001F2099C2|nr:hypothetical protein [Mycolicibacterium septicum]